MLFRSEEGRSGACAGAVGREGAATLLLASSTGSRPPRDFPRTKKEGRGRAGGLPGRVGSRWALRACLPTRAVLVFFFFCFFFFVKEERKESRKGF